MSMNLAANTSVSTIIHESQISDNEIIENSQIKSHNTTTPCPYCGKLYVRLSTHITKSHPEKHRERIFDRHRSSEDQSSSPDQSTTMIIDKSLIRNTEAVRLDQVRQEIQLFSKKFSSSVGKGSMSW